MIAAALRGAPYLALAGFVAWTGFDVVRLSRPRWNLAVEASFLLGIGCVLLGHLPRVRALRRLGIVLLGAAYMGARLLEFGVEIVPALLYVTLGILCVEFRILAERFAPLFERDLPPETRRGVDAAFGRAAVRLGTATGMAILVPILAADLALTGAVPVTTIPTAILLAAGFVVVAALLALLPVIGRRGPPGSAEDRIVAASRPKA